MEEAKSLLSKAKKKLKSVLCVDENAILRMKIMESVGVAVSTSIHRLKHLPHDDIKSDFVASHIALTVIGWRT